MRVEIDQPGHDQKPARIDDFLTAGREIRPDRSNFSIAKINVARLVAAARLIDDAATSEDQICHVHASGKIRRRDKTTISPFEQTGKSNAALVAVLRADDLHADRQPLCCEPGWCNS